jgi:uncharacterized damage-inducible protein DinB
VARAYPDGELHLVMDNYAAHKHPNVKKWLGDNPRVVVHFTPTHASWMNLVEVWCSLIERKPSTAAPSGPSATSTPRSARSSTAGTTAHTRSSGPKLTGELESSRTNMERMSDQPARWSRATIYPDMWADPDDDPRDSEGVSPDGELATLQDFLTNYRMTLRMKCEGLDAEQLARRSVPPSTMSLLGLLRHLVEVERDWRNWISDGDPLPKLYGEGDADFDGAVAEQAEVDAAYSALAREQAATDAALAEHPDLSERLGKDGIAVRELMVHRIEEYARHCGHADLLRECIDGRVGQ